MAQVQSKQKSASGLNDQPDEVENHELVQAHGQEQSTTRSHAAQLVSEVADSNIDLKDQL